MANTYTQIYIQVIFAVARRECLITKRHQEEINKFITGIIRNKNQKLIAIGGMPDHLHMLIGMQPDIALSDLVRDVKSSSSIWINDHRWMRGKFNWQEGFGGFSYSRSQIDSVARYILDQEKHHAKRSFRNEYLGFLKKFDIAFEERYAFEWVD
jgi:putative transposase